MVGITSKLDTGTSIGRGSRSQARGGFIASGIRSTEGVVLRTKDGGQTWIREEGLLLPLLQDVVMRDALHGIAVGRSSATFPGGIFTTDDGGRSCGHSGWEEAKGSRRR